MAETLLQHIALGKGHECSAKPHAVYLTDKGRLALTLLLAIAAAAKRPKLPKSQAAIMDAILDAFGIQVPTDKDPE